MAPLPSWAFGMYVVLLAGAVHSNDVPTIWLRDVCRSLYRGTELHCQFSKSGVYATHESTPVLVERIKIDRLTDSSLSLANFHQLRRVILQNGDGRTPCQQLRHLSRSVIFEVGGEEYTCHPSTSMSQPHRVSTFITAVQEKEKTTTMAMTPILITTPISPMVTPPTPAMVTTPTQPMVTTPTSDRPVMTPTPTPAMTSKTNINYKTTTSMTFSAMLDTVYAIGSLLAATMIVVVGLLMYMRRLCHTIGILRHNLSDLSTIEYGHLTTSTPISPTSSSINPSTSTLPSPISESDQPSNLTTDQPTIPTIDPVTSSDGSTSPDIEPEVCNPVASRTRSRKKLF